MSSSERQNSSLPFLKIHSKVIKSHEYSRIKDKPNNSHNTVLVTSTLKYNQIKRTSNFKNNTISF